MENILSLHVLGEKDVAVGQWGALNISDQIEPPKWILQVSVGAEEQDGRGRLELMFYCASPALQGFYRETSGLPFLRVSRTASIENPSNRTRSFLNFPEPFPYICTPKPTLRTVLDDLVPMVNTFLGGVQM
jgi:hypothetical protein